MRKQKLLWYGAAALALLGTLCIRVPGLRFSAALLWCGCFAVIAYAVLERLSARRRWALWGKNALLAALCAGLAFFALLESRVISGARDDAAEGAVSCVIVLGAGVNGTEPSLMLWSRLDAALAYVRSRPDVPIIVTGSQGQGEDISEAECMYRWLTARGVDPARVWKEEEATSTRTNFERSYDLMAERGVDLSRDFAFVTNDYHICRAKLLAGLPQAHGVAATLPRGAYYDVLTLNYYVREAFALANEMLFRMDLDV